MYLEAGKMIGGGIREGSQHVGRLNDFLQKKHPDKAIIVGPYRFNSWTVYVLGNDRCERTIYTDLTEMFDRPSELSAKISGSKIAKNDPQVELSSIR